MLNLRSLSKLFLVSQLLLTFHETVHAKEDLSYTFYESEDSISEDFICPRVLERASPFLLPDDSEIKAKLDRIFGQSRVTLNSKTMEKAGFSTGKRQKYSRIVVAKHKDLPGYIFKIYLDNDKYKPNAKAQNYFIKRASGALAIQNCIEDNNLGHLFKVPRKWIYILPNTPKPKKNYSFKTFVLVEDDMKILDAHENKRAWKSSKVTKETLHGLYNILSTVGLIDCTKIDNIPFSRDGKIAFVDTEAHGYFPVNYKRLKKWLSHSMKNFWSDLID